MQKNLNGRTIKKQSLITHESIDESFLKENEKFQRTKNKYITHSDRSYHHHRVIYLN